MENKILEILHDKQGREKKARILTTLMEKNSDHLKVRLDFGKSLKNLDYKDLIEVQEDFIILTTKGKKIKTVEELQIYDKKQREKERLNDNNDRANYWNNLLSPIFSALAVLASIYSIFQNNNDVKELKAKIEHLEQEVKQLKQSKTQEKYQPNQKDKNSGN